MKRWMTFLGGAACIAVLFAFYNMHVPPNMDELCHYQAISCRYYPANVLNIYREPCNGYFDIALWGENFLPLRSYLYIGTLPALIYFPIFLLWPSFESARLLGLLFLVAQAILINRITNIRTILLLALLCLFLPYSYQHAADTGPIVYHTTSVFLLICLFRRWSEELSSGSRKGWCIAAGIGALVFVNVWTKLSFLFLAPAIGLMTLYYILSSKPRWNDRSSMSRLFGQLFLMAVTAAALTGLLLNGMQRWRAKYYTMLSFYERLAPWQLSEIKKVFLERVWPYFLDPLKAAHRVFDSMEGMHYDRLWMTAGVILLLIACGGLLYQWRTKKDYSFTLLMLVCFTVSLYTMSMSKGTWAMHHVVLAFPFLILFILSAVKDFPSRKFKILLFLCFAAVNLVQFGRLTTLRPGDNSHRSLITLNHELNETFSKDYAFVVISWGFYYIKALYGNKDQAVIYIEPLDEQGEIDSLKATLERERRKPVFIGHRQDDRAWELIQKAYPALKDYKTSYETGRWVVRYLN